jgi:hypothetical protein
MKYAKMFRIIFTMLSLFVIALPFSASAQAQNCGLATEVILKLRKPSIGAYNLWDTVYGQHETYESFKALGFALNNDNVIAAGEFAPTPEGEKSLLLTEIDRRGRPVWEEMIDVEGLQSIVTMLTLDDRHVILANRTGKDGARSIWIGHFDMEGQKLRETIIKDGKFDLDANDMIVTHDLKSLLVAVDKTPRDKGSSAVAGLYWINLKSHRVTKDLAYALGAENKINALDYHGDTGYIGAGSVRGSDGRPAGWIINLNEQGGFNWQKQFPRGLGSRLFDVAEYSGDYIAVTGEPMAANEKRNRAAWVMMVHADSADVAWQRYYHNDYNLSGMALGVLDDSQLIVAINGSDSSNAEDMDYTRVLNLNGRGVILHADSYFNAAGAQASGMIMGRKNEKLVFGRSLVEYKVEKDTIDGTQDPLDVIQSYQGWIVAGAPADTYQDPCVQRLEFLQ